MKKCNRYKIYKFNYATPMRTEKQRKENMRRAVTFTKFREDLINKFCRENFMGLQKYTVFAEGERIKYKKDWLLSPYEIGLDMIQEDSKLVVEHNHKGIYMGVPKTNQIMIRFFDRNIPDWVTNVNKI